FGPFVMYQRKLGYVPRTALAQSLMPRLVGAQARLEEGILFEEQALSRILKEQIFLVVAASRGDGYGVSWCYERLLKLGASADAIDRLLSDYRSAGLTPEEIFLIEFCLKLSHWGPWVQASDLAKLRQNGFDDHSIHETVL